MFRGWRARAVDFLVGELDAGNVLTAEGSIAALAIFDLSKNEDHICVSKLHSSLVTRRH